MLSPDPTFGVVEAVMAEGGFTLSTLMPAQLEMLFAWLPCKLEFLRPALRLALVWRLAVRKAREMDRPDLAERFEQFANELEDRIEEKCLLLNLML